MSTSLHRNIQCFKIVTFCVTRDPNVGLQTDGQTGENLNAQTKGWRHKNPSPGAYREVVGCSCGLAVAVWPGVPALWVNPRPRSRRMLRGCPWTGPPPASGASPPRSANNLQGDWLQVRRWQYDHHNFGRKANGWKNTVFSSYFLGNIKTMSKVKCFLIKECINIL